MQIRFLDCQFFSDGFKFVLKQKVKLYAKIEKLTVLKFGENKETWPGHTGK